MLRQRLLSALVGLVLLILLIEFGGVWGWAAFVAVAGIAGIIEFFGMASRSRLSPMVLTGCVWTALLALSPLLPNPDQSILLVVSVGLLFSLLLLVRDFNGHGGSAVNWAITLAGVFYIGWLSRYLVALRALPDGQGWLMLALFTTFAIDTSAYFAGRSWGRRRLAPRISPGKTQEGAIAGMVAGIAASAILVVVLGLPLPLVYALLLGALLGVFAQVGDLTESVFKRCLGAKDSGSLMPGHGGILDRADSVLFSGIVVYYFVTLL